MNTTIENRLRKAKRRIERRLQGERADHGRPLFGATPIQMESSER